MIKDISIDDSPKEIIETVMESQSAPHEIEPSKIDLNALWVVRRLRAKGHEAYLTGGCVRDLLLGITPKDFDVATSARPEDVKSIFKNCRLIGRRFLLAHVVFPGGKIIETATFRANPVEEATPEEEGEGLLVSEDNVFGSMKEDAFRRDLTINGLFYDPVDGRVIDYVGGIEDLRNGLIRTIGDPDVRLQEDPVRILRAIKFAKRLSFDIESKTLVAMRKYTKDLLKCSPSRLQEELFRMLTGGFAKECFSFALDVGALDFLMPELLEGMGIPLLDNESVREGFISKTHTDSHETISQWHAVLGALDEVVKRDCSVSSSVAFTLLLLAAYERLEKSELNERNWIDKLCVAWSERIRLIRRDQDNIRILLTAIPLFSAERIHQKSAHYLVRKPWFREALLIYIIYLQSQQQVLDHIKVWKALALELEKPYQQERSSLKPAFSRFRKRRPMIRNNRRFRFGRNVLSNND